MFSPYVGSVIWKFLCVSGYKSADDLRETSKVFHPLGLDPSTWETALWDSAVNNSPDLLSYLHNENPLQLKGRRADDLEDHVARALEVACDRGNAEMIRQMAVFYNSDIVQTSRTMSDAIIRGDVEVVRALLTFETNIWPWWQVMHLAIKIGDRDMYDLACQNCSGIRLAKRRRW